MKRKPEVFVKAVLFFSLFFFAAAVSVHAVEPEYGSITIHLPFEKIWAEMKVYHVADYIQGEYVLTDRYQGIEHMVGYEKYVDVNHMVNGKDSRDNAKLLADWTKKKDIPAFCTHCFQEKIKISQLPLGLYLICTTNVSDETISIDPFFAGVPYWEIQEASEGTGEDHVSRKLVYCVDSFPKAGIIETDSNSMESEMIPGSGTETGTRTETKEEAGNRKNDNSSSGGSNPETGDDQTDGVYTMLFLSILLFMVSSRQVYKGKKYEKE